MASTPFLMKEKKPKTLTKKPLNTSNDKPLPRTDLVDVVLFTQSVKDDVDLVEHVHHLHGGDVDADLVELDHVAEQDSHIREDLRWKQEHEVSTAKCFEPTQLQPLEVLVFDKSHKS